MVKKQTSTDLNAVSQSLENGPEVWPLLGNRMPTLTHEAIDRTRTIVWRLETTSVGDELHHFLVATSRIRHVPQGHHLPQENTERPEAKNGV
jgi:hypothetical protein